MKGHEQVLRILASYRDATGEERAAADAHVATCGACADALAAYGETDARLAAAANPALPPRLKRPFGSLLYEPVTPRRSGFGLAFGRGFASAAIVLVLLIALSALVWTVRDSLAPITTTPTLTSTLTPTTITARETGPAGAGAVFVAAHRPLAAPVFAPTPAPAPAPRGGNAILFAASPAHATITH